MLRETEEISGMLETRTTRVRPHVANIGDVLAKKHWGAGLMPEAIREFASVAIALPAIFQIEATCAVDNLASARASEKSGFTREGRLARHALHPNLSPEPGDCWIYARTR